MSKFENSKNVHYQLLLKSSFQLEKSLETREKSLI